MASTKTEVDSTWVAPRTWVTTETVTAAMMNSDVRDNANALKTPAHGVCSIDEASDFTTTSTSFVDVDGAGSQLSMTITTGGGDVLVLFSGGIQVAAGGVAIYLTVGVDGVDTPGDDGITSTFGGSSPQNLSFAYIIEGLAAGAHTFVLRWKTGGVATATLYAGAGTATKDLHPQFSVWEI